MRLQTRLSGMLFLLIFVVCTGSALIVREALRTTADTRGDQVSRISRRMQQNSAQQAAWLGAHALEGLIESRLGQVEMMGMALSSAPGPGEVLLNHGAEPLRRINDTLATAGKELRFNRLVDANGQLALPPAAPDSTYQPPPFSLLEPPAPSASVPLQNLLRSALEGTPVASIETFTPELISHLAGESSDPTAARTPPSLILLAIHPVRSPDRQVVGAIVSGLDLGRDTSIFKAWEKSLELKGASASIIQAGTRIAVTGDGFQVSSVLAPEDWTALSSGPQRLQDKDRSIVRLALLNHEKQPVGALEVSVPVAAEPADIPAQAESVNTEVWLQRAFSWIGVLGVLVLILGILGSRGLVVSLIRLSRKAEAVSTGDLEVSFKDLLGKDEIGDLAHSFERMRISLKKLMERQQRSMASEERQVPPKEASSG